MSSHYFNVVHESADTASFRAGPATAGPWAAHLQHGGPPNALAVACAERAVRAATGRADLIAVRLAADFVGPVPVGDVDVSTRVVRAARSAALVEVMLRAAERDCLHVRVWFVRDADTAVVGAAVVDTVGAVPPVPADRAPLAIEFGYGTSLDWRFVSGAIERPGPAAVWVRPLTELFEGYELSGLARAVLVADSGSGVSSELDWSAWTFVNVDLDVHLARPVVGEWVLMQARTQLGAHGSALARSTLSDQDGEFGAGLQTLVLAPAPPPCESCPGYTSLGHVLAGTTFRGSGRGGGGFERAHWLGVDTA